MIQPQRRHTISSSFAAYETKHAHTLATIHTRNAYTRLKYNKNTRHHFENISLSSTITCSLNNTANAPSTFDHSSIDIHYHKSIHTVHRLYTHHPTNNDRIHSVINNHSNHTLQSSDLLNSPPETTSDSPFPAKAECQKTPSLSSKIASSTSSSPILVNMSLVSLSYPAWRSGSNAPLT